MAQLVPCSAYSPTAMDFSRPDSVCELPLVVQDGQVPSSPSLGWSYWGESRSPALYHQTIPSPSPATPSSLKIEEHSNSHCDALIASDVSGSSHAVFEELLTLEELLKEYAYEDKRQELKSQSKFLFSFTFFFYGGNVSIQVWHSYSWLLKVPRMPYWSSACGRHSSGNTCSFSTNSVRQSWRIPWLMEHRHLRQLTMARFESVPFGTPPPLPPIPLPATRSAALMEATATLSKGWLLFCPWSWSRSMKKFDPRAKCSPSLLVSQLFIISIVISWLRYGFYRLRSRLSLGVWRALGRWARLDGMHTRRQCCLRN